MTTQIALLEPATDNNIERATHWFRLLQEHGRATLEAAANLGEVLIEQRDICRLESKRGGSNWSQWVDDNMPFSRASATNYISISENWDKLVNALTSSDRPPSIREAVKRIAEIKAEERKPERYDPPKRNVIDHGPTPWFQSHFGPVPELDDSPESEGAANSWLDSAIGKLTGCGIINDQDSQALCYFQEYGTIREAVNSTTKEEAERIIKRLRQRGNSQNVIAPELTGKTRETAMSAAADACNLLQRSKLIRLGKKNPARGYAFDEVIRWLKAMKKAD